MIYADKKAKELVQQDKLLEELGIVVKVVKDKEMLVYDYVIESRITGNGYLFFEATLEEIMTLEKRVKADFILSLSVCIRDEFDEIVKELVRGR